MAIDLVKWSYGHGMREPMVGPDAGPDGSAAFTRGFPRRFPAGLSRHHPARCLGKGMKMPGKIAEFRELPGTVQKVAMLAAFAAVLSIVAIIVAVGSKNAG